MGAEKLKPYLAQYVESITIKSKVGLYNCPLCASGTGKNKSGAFSIKGDLWSCFACGQHGDTVDLIKLHENISDTGEAIRWGQEHFNITGTEQRQPIKKEQKEIEQMSEQVQQAKEKELQSFFINAHKDIGKTDYMAKRGISQAILDRFHVGYVEQYKNAGACVIIPTSTTSYMAREINGDKKLNSIGEMELFNLVALEQNEQPIFIVEGSIDAMSIIEVGGEAIGINGTHGTKKLIKLIEKEVPKQPLIICLDNDKAGQEESEKFKTELNRLRVPFYACNVAGEYKDPNEALIANKELFKAKIEQAKENAYHAINAEKEAYLKTSTAHYLQGFLQSIVHADTPVTQTQFKELDRVLDGGLYEGLYFIGAISSLGKTTMALQIADQIAQGGQDVLIFSLEMARSELMAKSISRHTATIALSRNESTSNAKTARGITDYKRYANYSDAEKNLIMNATQDYKDYANHIYINEGMGDIGVKNIKETIARHIKFTGNKPVVLVDYLQILAPYNERATEKQKYPREIELVILKNRSAAVGDKIKFKYYPMFNYFIEE